MSKFVDSLYRALTEQGQKVGIVDCGGRRSTSYAELKEKALQVAGYLREKQVPAHSFVCISLPKTVDYFACELGCWMEGHTVVPMGDTFPQERQDYIINHCQAALTLDSTTLQAIAQAQPTDRPVASDEDQLAAVFYTSGSTGTPKGVMHTFSSLQAGVERNQELMGMNSDDVFSTGAPMYFMASIFDFTALESGASVHVYSDEVKTNINLMEEYIRQHRVTCCFMSPTVVSQYTHPASSLRIVLSASERLADVAPEGFSLCNAYGQTETAGIVTLFDVEKRYDNTPIGRVVCSIDYQIVDEEGQPVNKGEEGELCLKGNLTPGYYLDEERTAQLWQNGWLHTGDLVKELEDGNLLYVNRKDWMVKINGQRVEPGEVEEIIKRLPGVENAIVKGFQNRLGKSYLVAYYIASPEVGDAQVEEFIRQYAPAYMVPSYFVKMESFPLNQNGKQDRKALTSPAERTEVTETSETLNMLEQDLHDIIAEVIGVTDFRTSDSLGYLGLTSISSIKLATAIYKKYGVNVKPQTLIKSGTLRSIEDEILSNLLAGQKEGTQADTQSVKADANSAPLTYPQTGVYLDCLKNPTATTYNVPIRVELPESVTEEELVAAIKATVENHQSFNLIFANVEGETLQQLKKETAIDVAVEDVKEEELEAFEQDMIRPFRLSDGPLFQFHVVRTTLADRKALRMYFNIHHLVIDGASVDLVIKEIMARINGAEVESEEYSYIQFANDQKAAEGGAEYQEAKAFFDQQLQNCEGASEITPDKPKDEHADHLLGEFRLPVDMKAAEALAKQLGVTPMGVFLAATYYTVSRFTNNKNVYLGTISNGRSNLRVYNTTGMFVNTLALSGEIKEQTVGEFIRESAQNFDKTIQHEQYPFAQIAADYGFQPEIVFEYQVGILTKPMVHGEEINVTELAVDQAKFNMKIAVYDSENGGQDIVIAYDKSLYTETLAETLAESLGAAVKNFIAQPETQVKHISIMSDKQRSQVETFRTTATADVPFKRFYEPIEYWAQQTPDNKAVVCCDRTLTFREFNGECNRVAHALMARGVKRGDRVVLLLPRTSQILCCIFGVSKTGAAYIPCDPAYPAERINLIIEDSEATYVITTQEHMAEHEDKAILVDELFQGDESTENPNLEVSPEDLAYLIYTSGSTGRPKGVMLRHIGICSYLYDHPANIHIHGLKTEGVGAFLCITTLSFDMSLKEFAGALHNGITAVLANEDEVNNPILLAKLFRETGAQAINGTPSRILNCMESEDFCEALSHCKVIWSGGEKYSDKLLQRLHEMNLRIFNTYGPTEITVSSNIGELTHQEGITVGHPLLNYTEFVVDSDGNELPAGVVGELYIGGLGVARGYNNLPEQTAARFIEYQGMRVYRSGDYARWMQDGQVDILGRLDNQVKLNGLRIELGEVESAISKVGGVKQTVVMIRNIDGRDHLSAYYVADHQIDIEVMKQEIGKTLTHYMVPTAYLQMVSFPLTPNGKTDVKHLPEPQLAQLGGDYVAPANKIEEDFCHAFESILSQEKVSAADSFFDLGGTSLSATRVIIEAKNYGYEIAYKNVFDHPTAQMLARLVGGADESNTDPEVTDYDYSKIDALLAENNLDNFRKGERLELGDIILTGANGYLGIHILQNLMENHLRQHPENKVYCMVRHGRNGVTSEARLRNLLFYYFEKSYKDMFGRQVIVIDGDVTNPAAFDEVEKATQGASLLTLINCAAIVKHFSEGTEIEDINIGGLKNCVDFCLKTGAHLIQTSTNSTGGESVNGYPDPNTNYSEQLHYFGQRLTSKYTHSKFLAERIVLENIINNGLIAKVVRLGNLAPRAKDGEFQINFRSNSAMGRLHIYQMLGVCGYTTAVSRMEFSPIDEVAEAVLLLATTPKECCIFHPFNNHMELMGDIIREMAGALDINIDEVEDEEFEAKLNEAAQDPEKAKILQSMLAYKAGGNEKVSYFAKYNPYTIQVLARLGFHWNVTSWDYVQRFVNSIAAMNFFEDKR